MTTPQERIYRPCVGMMVINKDGLVFVAQRRDIRLDAWQMPQGGIDEGESPHQAAIRELYEEIGTDKVELLAEASDWYHYDLPEELQHKMWNGQFRGQTQKWFLFRFLGQDTDIDLSITDEFIDWKWVEPHELKKLVVPFKIEVYTQVMKAFSAYIGHHP